MQSPDPDPPPEADKKFEIALPADLARAIGKMPPEPREALMNRILLGVTMQRDDGVDNQRFVETTARRAVNAWRSKMRRQRAGLRSKATKAQRKAQRKARRAR